MFLTTRLKDAVCMFVFCSPSTMDLWKGNYVKKWICSCAHHEVTWRTGVYSYRYQLLCFQRKYSDL